MDLKGLANSGVGMMLKSFGIDVDELIDSGKEMLTTAANNIQNEVKQMREAQQRIEAKLDALHHLLVDDSATARADVQRAFATPATQEGMENVEYGRNGDGGEFDTGNRG